MAAEARDSIHIRRISRHVEDAGSFLAQSKKMVTWRFVVGPRDELHTVILEHSLLKAKKIIKLDGWQILRQETPTMGDEWRHKFFIKNWDFPCELVIRTVAASVQMSGMRSPYDLELNGIQWHELPEQTISRPGASSSGSHVWSSTNLPRQVQKVEEAVSDEEVWVKWFFCFGVRSEVHTLILEHNASGRKILRLNNKLAAQYTQDHEGDCELVCSFPGHSMTVRILDTDPYTYQLIVDGVDFDAMIPTDFTLKDGWESVTPASGPKMHYRNMKTGETSTDVPTQPRGDPQILNASKETKLGEVGAGDTVLTTTKRLGEREDKSHEAVADLLNISATSANCAAQPFSGPRPLTEDIPRSHAEVRDIPTAERKAAATADLLDLSAEETSIVAAVQSFDPFSTSTAEQASHGPLSDLVEVQHQQPMPMAARPVAWAVSDPFRELSQSDGR